MQKVAAMDSTALNTLEHLYRKLHKRGIILILSGPHTQPYVLMENSGFLDQLGREHIAGNVDEALTKARACLPLTAAEVGEQRVPCSKLI
jgi:SulP family sulfate permease